MNARARTAAMRCQKLVARCQLQRAQLVAQLKPVGPVLESVDAGLRVARRLRRHPEWLAVAAAGLALLRPWRLSALIRAGAHGLRAWRRLAPGLQALFDRGPQSRL